MNLILKSRYINIRLLLAIILTTALSACATRNHYTDALDLTPVKSWTLIGKIAVQYPSPRCDQSDCPLSSDQGGLIWVQKNNNYDITISDPFGKTLVRISGNDQLARIKDNKSERTLRPTEMISEVLHLPIEYSTIKAWVTGRPDYQFGNIQRTREGFTQQNVLIEPTLWRTVDGLGKMPSKVLMQVDDRRVRIVIKTWQSA